MPNSLWFNFAEIFSWPGGGGEGSYVVFYCFNQCCGSMTFWCGSGSADPCLWLMGLDPDPDLDPGSGSFNFCHLPSRCRQKTNFLTQFFLLMTLWSYIYIYKIKIQKESQNSRNQGFSYYICMMIEGSGSSAGSGSIPLTSGSGSWRPKNMWILWIEIRIPNTGFNTLCPYLGESAQHLFIMA